MKKINFLMFLFLFLSTSSLVNAQKKQVAHYADINYDKVRYVAEAKTGQLNKIVQLNEGNQQKKIHLIYENYEIKKQKKLRDIRKANKHKYRRKPNRVQIVYTKHDEQKERQQLEKLDREAENKIKKVLTGKQRQLLEEHRENEKKVVTF